MTQDAALELAKQNEHSSNESNIEESAVLQYLQNDLNFLQRHPSLLSKIQLNYESNTENTVSLTQHQIAILRHQKNALDTRLNDLIKTAQTNENLFVTTKELIKEIIGQSSLDNLYTLLQEKISAFYQITDSNIMLFSDFFNLGAEVEQTSQAQAKQAINNIIDSQHIVCGTFRENEINFLFNANNTIKSAAVIPLKYEQETLGILSLGSDDDMYFQTGSETDLIEFLSDVIAISLNRFRT